MSRRLVRWGAGAIRVLAQPSALAGQAIVVASLLLCWRVVTGRQFEINDLSPVASVGDSISACVLPYQRVGLGRANPSPAPGLCDIGALSGVVGATAAQHIFLVGALMAAGLFTYALLRRLGNPILLSIVGALLYELSPALVDQFGNGGPGILLTGALLPGVALGFVADARTSPIFEGCRTAALLGLLTFFNPQAPIVLSLILAPLLVGALARSGRRWTSRFLAAFGLTYALSALPTIVTLGAQNATAAAQAGGLATDIRYSLGTTSIVSFVQPYMYVGVAAALTGAALLIRRRGTIAEGAIAVAAALVIVTWFLLRLIGSVIVAAVPLTGLFRDFIKFQVDLGLPIVVLSTVAFRFALYDGGLGRRMRGIALLFLGGCVVAPLAIRNGEAITSGYMGLEASEVPPVYEDVAKAIEQLDPSSADFRILWVPQDIPTNGILGARFPTSLMYRADAPKPATDAVLAAFGAFTRGDGVDIGPLLGDAAVRYVVVNRSYRGQAGASWEYQTPNIAAVGGTEVLAGAPSSFAEFLSGAAGLRPVAQTGEYVIYQNGYWTPLAGYYYSMLFADPRSEDRREELGEPISLKWESAPDVDWTRRSDSSVAIAGRSTGLWSPVQATFPAQPGRMYRAAGILRYSSVEAAHVKILWGGDVAANEASSPVTASWRGTGSISFTTDVVAPPGSRTGTLLLMGGWSVGGAGLNVFSDVSIHDLTVEPSPKNLDTEPQTRAGLARELPGTLIPPAASGPPADAPLGDITQLGTQPCVSKRTTTRCARLVTPSLLRFDGDWGFAASIDGPALEWFTEERTGHIIVPAAAFAGMTRGSSVQWAEYTYGDLRSGGPIPHRRQLPSEATDVVLSCSKPRCAIADIMLTEPLSPGMGITRVAEAPDPSLRGRPGDVAAIPTSADWATLYPGRLNGLPSVTPDTTTIIRWFALAIGNLTVVVGLVLDAFYRRLPRDPS